MLQPPQHVSRGSRSLPLPVGFPEGARVVPDVCHGGLVLLFVRAPLDPQGPSVETVRSRVLLLEVQKQSSWSSMKLCVWIRSTVLKECRRSTAPCLSV